MTYVMYGIIAVTAIGALRLLSAPIKWAVKLALNTLLGIVLLMVFNLIGGAIGITLGLNLANALVVALLGPLGLLCLLIMRFIFL